jgi:hypothetical protein
MQLSKAYQAQPVPKVIPLTKLLSVMASLVMKLLGLHLLLEQLVLLDLLALLVLLEQLGRLEQLVRLALRAPKVIQVLLDPQERMEILPTKSLWQTALSEQNPLGSPLLLEPQEQPVLQVQQAPPELRVRQVQTVTLPTKSL